MCTHKIIDCGNAFALGRSFEARIEMPQNINSTWLLDEVTKEFSGDTSPSNTELLLAPSSPLVQPQPARVETTCDAPLLTVSTQEGRVVFTKRV